MEKIFSTKYSELYFDIENSIFKMVWLESTISMNDADFKADMLKYIGYFYLNAKSVLHDMSKNQYIVAPNMQTWIDENVNASAFRAGIRKVAFLVSPDLFTMVSVEQTMQEKEAQQFEIAFFDDENKAWTWLVS